MRTRGTTAPDDSREDLAWSRPAFWLVLAGTYLAYSFLASLYAPAGGWTNEVFGAPMWYENDPGGAYITSAHSLYEDDTGPLYPGHPGLPLHLLLRGIQEAQYAVAGDNSGLTFTEFVARKLPSTYVASKLLATVLHLLSFVVVYRFSLRLLLPERAALLATLTYATSFPVLYFLSRVSIEPLMVLFFLGTFLCIWASHRRLAGSCASGVLWAFLAGLSAGLGFVSKMAFLGPLPAYGLLLLVSSAPTEKDSSPLRTKLRLATAYGLAGLLVLAGSSLIIDWVEFFTLWRGVAAIRNQMVTSPLPGVSASGIFMLTEGVFVGIGFVGWFRLLRCEPGARAQMAWVSVYVGYSLLVWGYRVISRGVDFRAFHYLFLLLPVLSVTFGYIFDLALRRMAPRARGARGLAVALALVLVLHSGSLWAAVDSRTRDIQAYAPLAPLHRVISGLGPNEFIGLTAKGAGRQWRLLLRTQQLNGLTTEWAPGGRTSALMEEYATLARPVGPKRQAVDGRAGELDLLGPYVIVREQPKG